MIAISESTKRDLVRLGDIPPEKIQVVYYGVNKSFSPCPPGGKTVAKERAELWAKYHLPPDTKLILHVNTRNRYKNTPAILEALARLNQKPELKGRVRLLRVGAEMFEDEEALVEKLGLGGQIIHAGRVYGDELMAPYYRAADVFAVG